MMQEGQEPVYILGNGAVGKVVAHALRYQRQDAPPVTLLLHRPSLLDQWLASDKTITVESYDNLEKSSGYEVELALPHRKSINGFDAEHYRGILEGKYQRHIHSKPISQLIVTVKAQATVSALTSIKHRLGPESSVLFLQNGMGVIDEVNKKVFPDPKKRPWYLQGINSHGMTDIGAFESRHAGHGTMFVAILPRDGVGRDDSTQAAAEDAVEDAAMTNPRNLMAEVIQRAVLAAVPVTPSQLQLNQLEKLAVNCVLNPLTTMYDCRNGDLLGNHATRRVMRLLLAEICLVIRRLPELQGDPNLGTRFDAARLETLVRDVARRTRANVSSMLQDVRKGRETEIRYINGYIVRRGEELGIKCMMNYMLMQMVDAKYHIWTNGPHGPANTKLPKL